MSRYMLLLAASVATASLLHAQSSGPRVFGEVGYAYRLNSYASNTFNLQRRHYVTSEVGLTLPVGDRVRAGAGTFFGIDEGGEVRIGFKARLRQRVGSVDIVLAPGVLVWDSRGAATGLSPVVSVSVFPIQLIGFTAQLESVPTDFPGGTDRALYLGVRMGGKPGRWANLVAAGFGAVIGLLYVTANGD